MNVRQLGHAVRYYFRHLYWFFVNRLHTNGGMYSSRCVKFEIWIPRIYTGRIQEVYTSAREARYVQSISKYLNTNHVLLF